MNPVQQVLSSIASTGISIKAKKIAEEHEAKDDARHDERMQIERQKLEQRERRDVLYERDIGVREKRAETESKLAQETIRTSKWRRKVERQQMKQMEAAMAAEQAGNDYFNARESIPNSQEIHIPIDGWTGTQEDD